MKGDGAAKYKCFVKKMSSNSVTSRRLAQANEDADDTTN